MSARQSDMFGAPPPEATNSGAPKDLSVTIELHSHRDAPTDKAWLLSSTGRNKDAKWVPKSVAIRDADFPTRFKLPRATALTNGWL